jgi:hypothetical protein
MVCSDSRLVRSFRNRALVTLLAGVALGVVLVASVAAVAPVAAKPRTLATRAPVSALAADGDRAALVVPGRGDSCASVIVWEPMRRRVVRLRSLAHLCGSIRTGTLAVALAGTRTAWLQIAGGNSLEMYVLTATLVRPTPVEIASGAIVPGGEGTFAGRLAGDGALLAFTVEERCGDYEWAETPCPPGRKTGYIIAATAWRAASRGRTRVAQANGELSVLAVDAGRIAVRTESGLRLLTADGDVVQEFDLRPSAAKLSGNRLAVRTADALKVYDIDSGRLVARFPAARGLRLEDLENDILVTASGRTVTLRRLGNGRTRTIRTGGIAHAQLERPGLFVAAGRRVTFTPIRDVLRRLDD